jgi:hypothetical protein
MGVKVARRARLRARARQVAVVSRARAWVARRDSDQLALALPLAIAGAYLVRFAQTFQDRITAVGGDSDAISPLVIAATMDEVPDGEINMAGFGHYMTLGYARATEWLPFDREIWQVMPPALWIASVGVVVWTAWRSAGTWAAILTGVLGLCVSPYLLFMLFSSSYHTWSLYSSAIAIGLLIYLTVQTRVGSRAWIITAAATLLLGGALASDRLVLVTAIGPLLLAGAGVALRHPTRQGRRIALAAALVSGFAVAVSTAVTAIMDASGFVTSSRTEGWIEAELFFKKVGWFLEENLWLFNGHFLGRQLTLESALSFAVAAGVVVALIAPFVLLRRRLRDAEGVSTHQELARSAYVFFWAATVAAISIAVIAGRPGVFGRYFLPVLLAAAATVPLVARSVSARYITVAGVSIYALLGVLTLDVRAKDGDLQGDAGRVAIQANELIEIARQERAHIGYAGYWEAASSSWSTKMQVKVFPVAHDPNSCKAPPEGAPCPYPLFTHQGWYVPRPGVRTFLIGPTPEGAPFPGIFPTVTPTVFAETYQPPRALGRPVATHRLFNGAYLYVYPYDIAARFSSSLGLAPE